MLRELKALIKDRLKYGDSEMLACVRSYAELYATAGMFEETDALLRSQEVTEEEHREDAEERFRIMAYNFSLAFTRYRQVVPEHLRERLEQEGPAKKILQLEEKLKAYQR